MERRVACNIQTKHTVLNTPLVICSVVSVFVGLMSVGIVDRLIDCCAVPLRCSVFFPWVRADILWLRPTYLPFSAVVHM